MHTDLSVKKILVVDHSKVITKIIQNFLSKSGFEAGNIFRAETKNQAMMMLDLESFDLITSGIHLKDSSGIELLKEIRGNGDEKKKNIPFLIISSDKEVCFEELETLCSNGFLSKPFTLQQIKEASYKALNGESSNETAPSPESDSSEKSNESANKPIVPEKVIEPFVRSTIEAMEQYMADANSIEASADSTLNGYFSSWVDLMDSEKRVQISMIINFPKQVACDIYEGIFGEVDLDQVCGVVQELVNILGGIVKPKISDYTSEIMELAYWGEEVPDASGVLNLDLGLPESKMGEGHTLDMDIENLPKIMVPFESKGEVFYLVVLFQKF
jgi:two-component system, chemotaxis family, chemotaxis protein CheY